MTFEHAAFVSIHSILCRILPRSSPPKGRSPNATLAPTKFYHDDDIHTESLNSCYDYLFLFKSSTTKRASHIFHLLRRAIRSHGCALRLSPPAMESISLGGDRTWSNMVLSTTASLARRDNSQGAGNGQKNAGIGIVSFLTAILVSVIIFLVQLLLFMLLRNKLARIL